MSAIQPAETLQRVSLRLPFFKSCGSWSDIYNQGEAMHSTVPASMPFVIPGCRSTAKKCCVGSAPCSIIRVGRTKRAPCVNWKPLRFGPQAHFVSCSAQVQEKSPDFVDPHETHRDTIVALSSGSGRSAVAVIRISGPQADAAVQAMLKPGSKLPQPRQAALRNIFDPASAQLLDTALVLRFPGPASFTGEDVIELQGHGGPAVVRSLLLALTSTPGVRLAEAGEFTRQAFMGGKLDLTEVEGIADLLAAETAAQHRQALQQTSGVQRRQYDHWRRTLLSCLAHVEAVIDFGDDNDIEGGVADEIQPVVQKMRAELEGHLNDGRRGELLRTGFRVALIGPPNAGKSTILNRLAGREAAIVSPTPGTTRDALEVALEIAGHKVLVTDTAGLRETEDAIEAEGVSRAHQAARDADIVLAVLDAAAPELDSALLTWTQSLQIEPETVSKADEDNADPPDRAFSSISTGWNQDPDASFSVDKLATAGRLIAPKTPVLLVINKWDLISDSHAQEVSRSGENLPSEGGTEFVSSWLGARLAAPTNSNSKVDFPGEALSVNAESNSFVCQIAKSSARFEQLGISKVVGVSAAKGLGLDLLLEVLQKDIAATVGGLDKGEGYMITRLRHRKHVQDCIEALQGYNEVKEQLELASEELRYAAKALGKITGAIDIEDILDAIFSEFCVGK